MKVSGTISGFAPTDFNALQVYFRNQDNRARGFPMQVRSNREAYPQGDMRKNKFKQSK